MPLDFSQIGGGRRQPLINPRDVFNALPTKPWPRLRLEQGEVLAGWFDRRDERDIVVKQNTGGGKTAVGLLIAQASVNEGVGPAVFLAPDTYLAAQTVAEASRLGIRVTDAPRDEAFVAGEAILVTTFQRLINGRSVFGVFGSGRPTQRIGTVVVDDAHAALSLAPRQYRLAVPATHPAFEALRTLFADELRAQSPSAWSSIENGEPAAPVRVPFWAWQQQQQNIRRILDPLAETNDLDWAYFSWPLVQQVLELCVATVNAREFEIRPPCSPVDLIPAFAQARRRVYLTATLADDGVLVTEFKASPSDVARPVTPARAADLGDRLILAPLSLNREADETAIRQLARDFADGQRTGSLGAPAQPINVIVLVPSDRRAALWASTADLVCHVRDLTATVARLKRGEHLGVVVLVNKYDGIDLPGDACRLLIIDGVPMPLDPTETREAAALHGTDTFIERQVQRVEQGMGRGIRDAEDYCAVLLLGSEMAIALRDPRRTALFSPATRAQITVSREVGEQIRGEGLAAVRDLLGQFLERNTGWLAASRAAIASVEYDLDGHVTEVAIARRRAFDLAQAGQPLEASQVLLSGIRALPPYQNGWYTEEAAAYLHPVDPDRAQQLLRNARLANAAVLRPITSAPVVQLRAAAQQAAQASTYLSDRYETAVALELGMNALLDSITFDPDRVEEAEAGYAELGRHLGFTAECPDKLYGTGPDDLWSVTADVQLILELKTGVDRADHRIIKTELDQLAGHINWHHVNYPAGARAIPVLVHPYSDYNPNGTPAPGTRVMTPKGLSDLKDVVHGWTRAIALDQRWQDATAMRQLLTDWHLQGHRAITDHTVDATESAAPVRASTPPPGSTISRVADQT